MSSSSPPEDPEYTSEPNILSPVSPKPIHFPTPDNIPVLQNQIDPAFNQMAAHIGDDAQQQVLAPGHADGGAAQPAQDNGSQDGGDGQGQSQDTANSNPQTLNSGFGLQSNTLPSAAASALTEGTSDTATQNSHTQTGYHAFPSQNPTVSPTAPSSEVPISLHDQANAPGANTQEAPGTQIPQPANGTDYQALLNSLQSSNPAAHTLDPAPSFIPLDDSSAAQNQPSAGAVDAASAGLPPRPPPQAQPTIHPNYSQTSDIRQYHPHASNTAQAAPNAAFQTGANGLPPPPVPSFQQPASKPAPSQTSPTTPNFTNHQFGSQQRDGRDMLSGLTFDGEPKWDLATQKEYDDFLEQERQYVTEGNWEQFPYGSRLFVGNLSSERVTKRDVFHVFHGYGKLAQISIKQAYGFVQFLNNSDCNRALHAEQGRIIRGKRINLEVSKPQKNRPGAVTGNVIAGRRRSRSPERPGATGTDRYVSGGSRQGDTRGRGRDDYRPGRSPSPPRARRDRSRDRHSRYRSRSRSPHGRGRYRSPSPRDEDDDLPLPRRSPRDVPDVQIIVVDPGIDRGFIQWVEKGMSSRGIKVDVLMLSPRLSEAAVIKRQIIEGVTAVVRMNRFSPKIGKIPLQVFDRRCGAEVRFEEYADLDPNIAAEVVLRAKANNAPAPAPAPSYGYGYGSASSGPPQQPPFSPSGMPPNLGNAMSSMDASGLQKLLGAMQPGQSAQQQPQLPPDLAKLLGGSMPGQQPGQYGQAQQNQDPLAALRANPALAGLLGGAPQQQQQSQQTSQQGHGGGQPNMADILAKLGSYKR
ncbi:RNA recognition motif-containing protein 17 [Elsinoe australis]|uniref:RNA recognition motif-containing protein 17 n=1 Tax=Elsinoe australis TaxID=40998 RepID=A0A4U7B1U0_9PEZI|nr:RNA recognition motif-containing protein 17 [Elsinoe australis]